MDVQEHVKDLVAMTASGKMMEAFEKYYADDVSMQENETAPTVGKEANRAREQAFFDGITEFKDLSVISLGTADDLALVETIMHVMHKDYGEINKKQVSVQHWKDGKIVSEKFYYAA